MSRRLRPARSRGTPTFLPHTSSPASNPGLANSRSSVHVLTLGFHLLLPSGVARIEPPPPPHPRSSCRRCHARWRSAGAAVRTPPPCAPARPPPQRRDAELPVPRVRCLGGDRTPHAQPWRLLAGRARLTGRDGADTLLVQAEVSGMLELVGETT